MSNPIDEYFKKNLNNAQLTPRKDLFAEKIAPRLQQRKAAFFFSPWLRVAAAVVVLLAAWQVVQLANQPAAETEWAVPQQNKVAIEMPEAKKLPEPSMIEEDMPETQTKPAIKKQRPAPKGNGRLVSTTPAGSSMQNASVQPATGNPQGATPTIATEQTKANYKLKLRIDPARYLKQAELEPAAEVASAEATPTFIEYAAAQVDNIKDFEKVQAPPKEWFELSKLGALVEGSPLKKVLPAKE